MFSRYILNKYHSIGYLQDISLHQPKHVYEQINLYHFDSTVHCYLSIES
jgi:hypothetical protein